MSSSAAILNRSKREGRERKMEEGYITTKEKEYPEWRLYWRDQAGRDSEWLRGIPIAGRSTCMGRGDERFCLLMNLSLGLV
jgi:hypothetical protein